MSLDSEVVPHNRWVNRLDYEAAVLGVLRSGHVDQSVSVIELERQLAARFRPGGACAVVSSGTAALFLALVAQDDHTLHNPVLPTYACSALYQAVEMWQHDFGEYYAPTAFCDVNPLTFNAVDPCSVFVHTYGLPGAVPEGAVEDFTHAPGASLDGKPCGSLGRFSVISFGATKPLGVGAGGAVLSDDVDAIVRIRSIRDYDMNSWLPREVQRFNWKLGDIYAAMAIERLQTLGQENLWRNHTALMYWESMGPLRYAHPLHSGRNGKTWYRFVIQTPDWVAARAHFTSLGIETINPLRPDELLHMSVGAYGNPARLPVAEAVAHSTLSLPIWPGMTDEHVARVCDALSRLPR